MEKGSIDDLMPSSYKQEEQAKPTKGSVDDLMPAAYKQDNERKAIFYKSLNSPKDDPIDSVSENLKPSNFERLSQAAYTGVLDVGTNLLKGMYKINPFMQAGDVATKKKEDKTYPGRVQEHYKEQVETYEKNAEDAPISSGIARFGGSMAVPVGGYGTSGIAKGVTSAIGKSLPSMAGKALGGMAEGGLTGGLLGGLMGDPNASPEDTFNAPGAAMGAGMGLALGPLAPMTEKYGERTAQFGQLQKDLSGYKGPIISRDLKEITSRKLTNSIMDNVYGMTTGMRSKQRDMLQPYLQEFVTGLSDKSANQSRDSVQKLLRNTYAGLQKQSNELWDDLYKSVGNYGLTRADSSKVQNQVNGLISDFQVPAGLKRQMNKILDKSTVSFEDLHFLKRSMGNTFSKIDRSFNATPADDELSAGLRSAYHGINDLIEEKLRPNEALYSKFIRANQFTKGFHETFEPTTQRTLMKALDKKDQLRINMDKFIDSLTTTTDKAQRQYGGLLGKQGNQEVQNIVMKDAFDKALSGDGTFNVNEFLTKTLQLKDSPFLENKTVQALKGVQTIIKSVKESEGFTRSIPGQQISGASRMAAAAGAASLAGSPLVGDIMSPAAVAGVFLGARTLGFISRHSPLKNTLILADKAMSKGNGNLIKYLTRKAGQQMIKAGIIMKETPEGTVLDREEK